MSLDTGSNCNILGVSSAERLNLTPKNPIVSEVEGFDLGKKRIQGEVEVEMTYEQTKKHRTTKLYTVEGIEKKYKRNAYFGRLQLFNKLSGEDIEEQCHTRN